MPRRRTLALDLTPAELRMLEQLSDALGASPQDALRRLLREAYQRRVQRLESRAGFGFLDLIPEPSRVAKARGRARPARPAAKKKPAKRPAKAAAPTQKPAKSAPARRSRKA